MPERWENLSVHMGARRLNHKAHLRDLEVVESGQEANRPGDATNAPGHDTEEVTSMPDKRNAELWYGRAERLLEEALEAMREERIDDMAGSASLAVACIHVVDGTEDPAEFEGYSWPGESEDESDCICTPEQLARGGFRGGCPVHSYVGTGGM